MFNWKKCFIVGFLVIAGVFSIAQATTLEDHMNWREPLVQQLDAELAVIAVERERVEEEKNRVNLIVGRWVDPSPEMHRTIPNSSVNARWFYTYVVFSKWNTTTEDELCKYRHGIASIIFREWKPGFGLMPKNMSRFIDAKYCQTFIEGSLSESVILAPRGRYPVITFVLDLEKHTLTDVDKGTVYYKVGDKISNETLNSLNGEK